MGIKKMFQKKFNQKKFIELKEGTFVKPKLILRTRKTMQKRVSLARKIVKQYKGLVSISEGKIIKTKIINYQEQLKKLNIPVLETKVILNPIKPKKYQLTLIQKYVPKRFILSNYLLKADTKQNLNCLKQVLTHLKRIEKFNEKSKQKITIDAKPDNFAVINGKICVIDLYPPFIKNTGYIDAREIREKLHSTGARLIGRVFKKEFERQIRNQVNDYFDPIYNQKRTLLRFIQINPALKKEYKQLAEKQFKITLGESKAY